MKMVLLPQNVVQKLYENESAGVLSYVDKELKQILYNAKLNDQRKTAEIST